MHPIKKIFRTLVLATGITLCLPPAGRAQWQALPFRLNHEPTAFFVDTTEDALYIGGGFWRVNDTLCRLLRWDGSNYTRLPYLGGGVGCISRFQGKLCVGGGMGTFYLSGNQWIRVSDRVTNAFAHIQGKLALVGGPSDDDDTSESHAPVRLWDGTSAPLQDLYGLDSVFSSGFTYDLQEYNGQIYVCGKLGPWGGASSPKRHIVRWDGTRWRDVGGGGPAIGMMDVMDLEVWNGNLYIAGRADDPCMGPNESVVVRWDGTQYWRIGDVRRDSCQGGIANSLCHWRGKLVATGGFSRAAGLPVRGIAAWDGTRWCGSRPVFTGPNNSVIYGPYKAHSFRDTLYIGGWFNTINGDSTHFLARWVGGPDLDTSGAPVAITPLGVAEPVRQEAAPGLTVSPNPSTGVYTVRYEGAANLKGARLTVINAVGQIVVSRNVEGSGSGKNFEVNLAGLPAGVYLLWLSAGTDRTATKLIKH